MPNHPPYLALTGVCKSFGQFHALREISLAIGQGEFVCFLGPSGCGKTTLLRIIAGLETQDRGQILQGGRDISWAAPGQRDYGIVFQSYALFPNLTIAQNVAYGLVNRRQNKATIASRVQELLELVGLASSGEKYPGQLSGGQQQRIALARALATAPGMLLLDEPLSALDALERVRLRSEIRQLQQRLGITTIMVTHDQEEALAMADRIVVMNHGVIEQVGTPQQIYLQPHSSFVASFVGKVNVLQATSQGQGRLTFGALQLSGSHAARSLAEGQSATLYVRPEEFFLCPDDNANAQIQKIEFLGPISYLLVAFDGMPQQAVSISMTLAALQEYQLQEGSRCAFGLLPQRVQLLQAQQMVAA